MKTKNNYKFMIAAVAGVLFGISSFTCCSNDEWDGLPDYVPTLAPRLTRAGVENGGQSNYASCGIWCIAYLRNNDNMKDSYDYVQYQATKLKIPTTTHIMTSQMVTLAQACGLSISNWITKNGTNVPADTIKKKIYELSGTNGKLPYYNILGYGDHYVIGQRVTLNEDSDSIVNYIDPNNSAHKSKNINEFDALIY